jgi:hypothetical protein
MYAATIHKGGSGRDSIGQALRMPHPNLSVLSIESQLALSYRPVEKDEYEKQSEEIQQLDRNFVLTFNS